MDGLAHFLQFRGMKPLHTAFGDLPVEDRIDRVTRIVLLGLLLATLACIV